MTGLFSLSSGKACLAPQMLFQLVPFFSFLLGDFLPLMKCKHVCIFPNVTRDKHFKVMHWICSASIPRTFDMLSVFFLDLYLFVLVWKVSVLRHSIVSRYKNALNVVSR